MTKTENLEIEQEELKRYLYAELSDEEREELEQKFFLDDELFFEVADLENRLVDRYARGKLAGGELLRFEKSLGEFPERKQKVANAAALQNYIEAERPANLIAESSVQTLWEKLSAFFTFNSPVLSSAMAGLLVIFMLAGILLLLDGRRKGEELAKLQNERAGIEGIWQKREDELKGQLSNSNQRLEDLKSQLSNKDEDTEDLIKSLGSEQQKLEQLQKDLEKLRQAKSLPPQKTAGPTIASILLSPTTGNRAGNDGGKLRTASIGENTKKIAINLSLPDDLKKDEVVSIQLNEKPLMQNVSPRVAADGKRSISLTIPIRNLNEGPNKLSVIDSGGKEITKYIFNLDKP